MPNFCITKRRQRPSLNIKMNCFRVAPSTSSQLAGSQRAAREMLQNKKEGKWRTKHITKRQEGKTGQTGGEVASGEKEMVVLSAASAINIAFFDIRCYFSSFSKFLSNGPIFGITSSDISANKITKSYAHHEPRQLITKTRPLNSINSNFFCNDSMKSVALSNQSIFNRESQSGYSYIGIRSPVNLSFRRYYSSERNHEPLPRLMDFPQIAWPSIFKAIKNWILAHFIITPYFDREFRIQDFLDGSKQVLLPILYYNGVL